MTTLTLLKLNREGQRLSVRDWHAVLANAADGNAGRLLWAQPRRDTILTRTETPPNLLYMQQLIESHHQTDDPVWLSGSRVTLSGVVNPRKSGPRRCSDGAYKTGVKKPVERQDVPTWAAAKLAHCLDVEGVTSNQQQTLVVRKPGAVVTAARFHLRITGIVTDPGALQAVMVGGFGSCRAYGCGLLLARSAS